MMSIAAQQVTSPAELPECTRSGAGSGRRPALASPSVEESEELRALPGNSWVNFGPPAEHRA
jgi:hypothetical protein